jgi:hypothetical protein
MNFADSLRIVMENTRNLEATAIGAGFTTAWPNISLDQQQLIKRQTYSMRKKGYKLRPHLVPYIGAIVAAVTIEGSDATQLGNFLKVAGKVIDNYKSPRVLAFFNTSCDFLSAIRFLQINRTAFTPGKAAIRLNTWNSFHFHPTLRQITTNTTTIPGLMNQSILFITNRHRTG